MDLGKKASSANSLFVEAQSQDGDSDSSKCTYLADDVNKVFEKVLRKISRVKMERFVTN